MAAGMKLFLSRLVRDTRLVSFSRRKREYLGCVGSLIMLAAFPRQREVWTESMDGRLVCIMDWATFIILCSFLQLWAEPSCDTTRKNAFYGASVKVGESRS